MTYSYHYHFIFDYFFLLLVQISRIDADKLLASKVDGQVLSTVATKMEDTLAEHERLITALRLRYLMSTITFVHQLNLVFIHFFVV